MSLRQKLARYFGLVRDPDTPPLRRRDIPIALLFLTITALVVGLLDQVGDGFRLLGVLQSAGVFLLVLVPVWAALQVIRAVRWD